MQDKSYEKAIKQLETLQSRFPYGRYAQQAQMEIAYAYFKHSEPAPAFGALDRFVKMYPNSSHLDYVLYLKGLINFNRGHQHHGGYPVQSGSIRTGSRVVARVFRLRSRNSSYAFPISKYVADARIRMQYLLDTLANGDIHVASYYLKRGAYVAAVNRAKNVLVNYPQTPQTRDALQIMVQAYDAMGMKDLSADTKKILDRNVAKDGIKPIVREMPSTTPWWKFWS